VAKGPQLTADNIELQFAVNHVSHFLIVSLLLPTLVHTISLPSSDVRIINLTSEAWKGAISFGGIKFDTLNTTQTGVLGHWVRYSQSKLANVLFSLELARRYPEITTLVFLSFPFVF
jgi:NAD(P)-dependent dehydrogenase (short-subunit alcohol dehydrogenase family)